VEIAPGGESGESTGVDPTIDAPKRPSRPEPSPLVRGACVGRYVLLDAIGEGGMGIVYKAYDPELERPVALKLVHARGKDASSASVQRDRLLREAKALARLSHPNVLAVYDVGTFGEDVFIATEFIEGRTLGGWLRDAKRSQSEVLRAFLAAGEGLAAAHRAGLVHRDFKPANVIVGKDGRVRVLDFGLARAGLVDDASQGSMPIERAEAKALPDEATAPTRVPGAARPPDLARSIETSAAAPATSAPITSAASIDPTPTTQSSSSPRSLLESPLTEVGQIVGTPRFMAPEQHLGLAVDARSDQFSFCVTLYDALYGELPFEGLREKYEENLSRGDVRPPPPKSDVPRHLRAILLRGLEVFPADRYASMDDLLADLRRDPRASRRRWLAIGAASMAVVAGALALRHERQRVVPVCQGGARKLGGVWDEDRRRAMHAAFAGSGSAFAEDAFHRAEAALDDYARRWVAMHGDACEATRVRGEQSEELLDLRMECLGQRLDEVKAQVDVLAHADAKTVERAVQAVRALPTLDACADAAALRAPVRAPADPSARARVASIRSELAAAKALQRAGKYAEATAIAARLASEAAATGYRPLDAEALYLLGDLEDDAGDYAGAERTLGRAAAAAMAGHHDVVLARALSAEVVEIGLRQARFAEAHEWAVLAEAAVERTGDPFVRGELPRNVGRLLLREGKYDESRASIAKCLSIWEPALGREDLAVAGALTDLGNVSFTQARYEDAIAIYTRSVSILESALGPTHPYLAPNLNNVGEVMMKLGELDRARASLGRALTLWEAALGPDHPKVALALYNRGQARNGEGDHEGALADATRALAILQKAHGDAHPDVALGINGVANVLYARGQYARALEEYERALAIRQKVLGADHVDLAESLVGIGETRLAMRAPSLAVAPLERALTLREAHPGDPVELGDTRFALARALRDSGLDKARAATLAAKAQGAYASAAGPLAKKRLNEIQPFLTRAP
jgi:serine/threonine protein kinase/tetratricopeptide (TPR) repeat protein